MEGEAVIERIGYQGQNEGRREGGSSVYEVAGLAWMPQDAKITSSQWEVLYQMAGNVLL